MSYVYINLQNLNPNFSGTGTDAKIILDQKGPGGMYSLLVRGAPKDPSDINSIISNPNLLGINIFVLNSLEVTGSYGPNSSTDYNFVLAHNTNYGLNANWLFDSSGQVTDKPLQRMQELWKQYFNTLKIAFPKLQIGVSFGGLGFDGTIPTFIDNLNNKYLIDVLNYYQCNDFIEFDIESDWKSHPTFSTSLKQFLDNNKSINDYNNTKIKVGANNPIGSSLGSGTGAVGTPVESGAPEWIKDYDNLQFVVYTYALCTSNNLFDNGNPWFPQEGENSYLPNDSKNIQFAITGYDSECPSSGGLSQPYSYVENGLKGNTASFLSNSVKKYGPFNFFWASQINSGDTITYPFDNINKLLNFIPSNKPQTPTKINSIIIVNNNLNIKYS